MPYEYYCWLLENLENYIQTFCGKDRRELYGCLKGKITVSSDCFEMYDTTPEFEGTFRKNFRKLLIKS